MGSLLRCYSTVVLGMLLLCTSANVRAVSFGKIVNVSMRAKTEGTSLLLQAGELLAKERNDLHWRFIEQWLKIGEFAKLHTDKECVQHTKEKGSSLLRAPLFPLFRLSLSLRSASPKLVLSQQLATKSLAAHEKAHEEELHDICVDKWSLRKTPSAPKGRCCWIDSGSQIFFEEPQVFNWLQFLVEERCLVIPIDAFWAYNFEYNYMQRR